jgi:D-sedoheptulose 7-phosphate isomerase
MNIEKYKTGIIKLVQQIDSISIFELIELIKKVKKNKGRILIVGNGGSISTANHIAVDLTKNAKIQTIQTYNDNLITCYANDYGYKNWISKLVDHHLNKNDIAIFLSVSGNSENLINAAKLCKKKKITIATLTGQSKKNKLRKYGKINYWVNSKSYNQVEAVHFIILAIVVDKLVGREVYGTKL